MPAAWPHNQTKKLRFNACQYVKRVSEATLNRNKNFPSVVPNNHSSKASTGINAGSSAVASNGWKASALTSKSITKINVNWSVARARSRLIAMPLVALFICSSYLGQVRSHLPLHSKPQSNEAMTVQLGPPPTTMQARRAHRFRLRQSRVQAQLVSGEYAAQSPVGQYGGSIRLMGSSTQSQMSGNLSSYPRTATAR